MFCTAFSIRDTDNWLISNWTIHIGDWAGVRLTFCRDDGTVRYYQNQITFWKNLKCFDTICLTTNIGRTAGV